jgi:dTMP kinase
MTVLNHLIVFEGLDGAGTTTQIKLAVAYLARHYPSFRFETTAEPQPLDPVVPLRRYLAEAPRFRNVLDRSKFFALLFSADRLAHLETVVGLPGSGRFVLSDRYLLSTLAYQAHQPEDPDHRAWIENLVRPFPLAGLTIYLRVEPEQALRRVKARARREGTALEVFETLEKLRQTFYGYEAYVAQSTFSAVAPAALVDQPGRVVTVDGSGKKAVVWAQIKTVLDRYLDLFKQASFDFAEPA